MKFNQMTYHISLALLGLTAVYLLMYSGMTGILLVAAATMISAAFLESVEMVTAVCVVSALLYVLVFKRYIKHLEPFQDSAASIKSRIGSIQQKYSQKGPQQQQQQQQPQGVYHKSVEGFADVSSEKKEGAPSESSSATQIVPQVDSEEVKRVTAAVDHAENEEKDHNKEEKDKKIAKEDFQSATNGLFKLGQMPSENTGGPHLDAGSTIMKAMSSFDKNTVSAMTADTKKLLETQKGLMSMLNEMRPVLKDGKELLETFSGMFGGNSGAANMLFSM
jgi:hypothetical protein